MNLLEAITALHDGKRIRHRKWDDERWLEFDRGRGPTGQVVDEDSTMGGWMWEWEGWETVPKGVDHTVLFVTGDPGKPSNNMAVEIHGVRYQLIQV